MNPLDQELLVNKVLDRYGEAMRTRMLPKVLDLFDALTPEARRWLVAKKLNEVEA